MIIIAIETSCDETSVAILENKRVLSNSTISQLVDHQEYGGVVPSLASSLHLRNIPKVISNALNDAQISLQQIDYVAYTETPGLIICLQIGKVIAQTISLFLSVPLIPCNHLIGHAYSSLINREDDWQFPAISLVVSGGHTQLYLVKEHLSFQLLGETLDDAVGECFDKVSVLLGYQYPGGPVIERLATGGSYNYHLTLPKNDQTFDFSFSGLKSEVRRILLSSREINVKDLSFSLQETVNSIISKKLLLAFKRYNPKTLIVGGGVVANLSLRKIFTSVSHSFNSEIKIFIPQLSYCSDNAAMIGLLAYYKILAIEDWKNV